jgi:hypothetical protein
VAVDRVVLGLAGVECRCLRRRCAGLATIFHPFDDLLPA